MVMQQRLYSPRLGCFETNPVGVTTQDQNGDAPERGSRPHYPGLGQTLQMGMRSCITSSLLSRLDLQLRLGPKSCHP